MAVRTSGAQASQVGTLWTWSSTWLGAALKIAPFQNSARSGPTNFSANRPPANTAPTDRTSSGISITQPDSCGSW